MHFYNFNIADFNNSTRHLSLVERALYRDLIDMYYHHEEPIDGSDMDKLARRLICKTEDDHQALAYVLDEFFVKRGKKYHHHRIDKEIKNYRYKNRNADVTQNVTPVTQDVTPSNAPCNANGEFETPMTPAERAHKSRLKKKGLIADLSNAGVDTKDLNDKTPMAKLEALYKEYVTPVTQDVTPSNDGCNASNVKNAAITINQEPITKNQEPNINNSLSKTREENFEAEKICDQKSQDINAWSPPDLKTMQDTLTMAGCSWQLTQSEYDLHVSDFKAHYAEQALIGKGLVTESRRVSKLRKWLQDEYVKQQRQSKKFERFNIDNEDWGSVGKRPAANTNDDIPDVYHASHSKPTQQAKADPKLNVMVNGLWREPLPGMSVNETYRYIEAHKYVGELQDEAYDRLLGELQEIV